MSRPTRAWLMHAAASYSKIADPVGIRNNITRTGSPLFEKTVPPSVNDRAIPPKDIDFSPAAPSRLNSRTVPHVSPKESVSSQTEAPAPSLPRSHSACSLTSMTSLTASSLDLDGVLDPVLSSDSGDEGLVDGVSGQPDRWGQYGVDPAIYSLGKWTKYVR